ncbi:ornithine--oxo-acid transaminase [Bacteroidetes bacterium endosymbiont of Geopemphigus sp.]|uniref:ornithine--oxo-acid transaminase n=1 Tax=Bacteroidetes bacterium endosymbiont of Geopemphigus sp. TaxID=2047937 RepID=UPI000CD0714C|nr:ornithine--oxo-acid transaminase [Bacteroidetes bacterium endosymbiont of Geopemphigus sp.]
MNQKTSNALDYIALEEKYGAYNYHPMPVVLEKGEGVFVWDVEGKWYYDFLSSYSSVNQWNSHPEIINALKEQAKKITLTSLDFYNHQISVYEKRITEHFGFDKVLPMNTGAEAVEISLKLCRKWGYEKKNICGNQSLIIVCKNNFHGRTSGIISFSSDSQAYAHYGPYMPGFLSIPYDDSRALEEALGRYPNVAGFLLEPIQGEAGVIVPQSGYLKECQRLCKADNVLLIADEVQTGIGHTGKMLACDYEGIQVDVLILGKTLSGGVYPISEALAKVLANDAIMEVIRPGQHGSTFGGNSLACAVALTALNVIEKEQLAENARILDEFFREEMQKFIQEYSIIKSVRGKGLLNALVVNSPEESELAWKICLDLKLKGLLAKPMHSNIIHLAPPLTITKAQLIECAYLFLKAVF